VTPDDVVARIDWQELVDLALALGNIDSRIGNEGPAGQFVFVGGAGAARRLDVRRREEAEA